MLPYYSFPFSYSGRNSAGMQQIVPYEPSAAQQALPMGQMPEYIPMPQQNPWYNMPYNQAPAAQAPVEQFTGTAPQMQPYQNQYLNPELYDAGTNYGYSPDVQRPEDPPPILSNNPTVTSISLFKELTAYPNYGNPSGNADILYTGNTGTWTFDIPAFLLIPGNSTGRIVIRGVLDDMNNTPANRYSARIIINGIVAHTGRLPLEHGRPVGGKFTNWRELTFNITNLRRNNRVVIENTSNAAANDWIAFDWMDLRLSPR